MQQQQESFFESAHGWAVVSARGGKNHVTRVTGTWYGALEASAICGTKPAKQYGQHHGWVIDLSQHATVPEAAQAAGGMLCTKCLKKAEQAAARERLAAQAAQEAAAEAEAEAEALSYSPELQQLMQQQAAAQEAEQAMAASWGFTPAGWAALAWQDREDYRDRTKQAAAWQAAQDAAAAEQQALQPAGWQQPEQPAARPEAARLTLAKTPADLPAVVEPAAEPAAPALPCQCEHSECTHDYLAVPAGNAAAMFIGPICDDCVSHMRPYLLKDEQAASITAEVRHMWEQQQAEAAEAAAAEAAADPAEPGTWTGDYWQACPECEEGEFHYVRQGSCWTCDLPRLQRIRQAEEAAAEALQLMPNVRTWAVSAMVYLDDRGYAVERTIRRNLSRASLPVVMAVLGDQENLSKLSPYPDGMG